MQLKTEERFGSVWLSHSMARHRRCSVYVLPNGPLSFPTSLIGPPHREPKQGWHINITARWVASILLSRFEVMTELSRMDFTWRYVCQHSLRLVYWIKYQKEIKDLFFYFFCLMQSLRGWLWSMPIRSSSWFPPWCSFQCPLKIQIQIFIPLCKHSGKKGDRKNHTRALAY